MIIKVALAFAGFSDPRSKFNELIMRRADRRR